MPEYSVNAVAGRAVTLRTVAGGFHDARRFDEYALYNAASGRMRGIK